MAGDWIKIRTDLYEDQDVLQMSDILGTDDPTTVGLLVRFWSWADKQTIDGNGIKITKTRIDSLTGRSGFASAMIAIGWLTGEDGSLQLPNFQRHNGVSGKARALESEAKRLRRSSQKMSDKLSDNCPTKKAEKVRPEKRREEKSTEDYTTTPPAHEVPTLEAVHAYAAAAPVPISKECATAFYDSAQAEGWLGRSGRPIADWRAALRRYASRWNEIEKSKPSAASRDWRAEKAAREFPEPQHKTTPLPRA